MKNNSEETKAGALQMIASANTAAGDDQKNCPETSSIWVENSQGGFLPASRVSLSDTNDSIQNDGDDKGVALPTIKSGLSRSEKHYKSGDVVWSQKLREYLKLEKGVGKTPSGKQYWDCQSLSKPQGDKLNDEVSYKSLNEEDFTSYLNLKVALYLLTESKAKPAQQSLFRVSLSNNLKESLLKPL